MVIVPCSYAMARSEGKRHHHHHHHHHRFFYTHTCSSPSFSCLCRRGDRASISSIMSLYRLWVHIKRRFAFVSLAMMLGLFAGAFLTFQSSDDVFSKETSKFPVHRFWMPASFQSSLIRIGGQNSSETSETDSDQDDKLKEALHVGPMRTLEEIFNLSEERMKKKRDVYTCKPRSNIVFLKTHKTGSSTIQNLLYRFGDSNKLTFALPRNNGHRFSYPMSFKAEFVEGVTSGSVKEFNILCNHMTFKKSEVAKVMPADTFYFSILRHPVPMLESMFNYFKKLASKYENKTIGDYLDDCWKTYKPKRTKGDYSHNNLAFDFGSSNTATAQSPDLQERVDTAIKEIEGTFNLILINEYFDESLILLKEALCWSMEDMVTFKINSRSDESRKDVSEETAEKIKRWNALDWGLYQHFNATFWERVDSVIGREEIKRQVAQLRDLRAKMANTCLENGGAVKPSEIKDESLKPFQGSASVLGYNLNPNIVGDTKRMCLQLITPELQYTSQLYERQFPSHDGEM